MREKIVNIHKGISQIQNAIWAAYKEFLDNQDMKAFNRRMTDLATEYRDSGNLLLASFVENEIITWCPVMNIIAEEFRKGDMW